MMGIGRVLHTHESFSYCWCERIIHKLGRFFKPAASIILLLALISSLPIANTNRFTLSDDGCIFSELAWVSCMGGVLVILIPNQHISILQFIVFSEQQITEKLYKERLVWLYAFLGITIIGTYKGIMEVPGIVCKQLIVYLETTRTEISDNENSSCSRISFTERMVLP